MWGNLYNYNNDSPSGLVHSVDKFKGKKYTVVAAIAGTRAGYLNPDGYWRVSIGNGKYRKAHLVVWEIHFGKIEKGMVIDHINRDSSDNRIENLRKIDRNLSARNKSKPKNNTSGVVGVKLNTKKGKSGISQYWLAEVSVNGIRKVKHFNIDILGYTTAFQMACDYRKMMIDLLNKNGAGYTDTHGQ